MSARGSLALGSNLIAESKRLIPVSWLAFLAPEHSESLLTEGSAEVRRKSAIENFDFNAPFLAKITSGTLKFDLSERLIAKVRSSRARKLQIEIGDLLNETASERDLPTIKMVIDAIHRKDPDLKFVRPSRKMASVVDGELINVNPITLNCTADLMYSVCWITERWLQFANKQERESMVTGYVYP